MSVNGTAEKVQPSESDVVEEARSTLQATPGMGIGKLLAHLQATHNWALSEKRLKTILTKANLRKAPQPTASSRTPSHVPLSHLDDTLTLPSGVRAVYFDSVKGKGLVADRAFRANEVVFTEDAFIAAPPSQAMQQVARGELCTQCFLPLAGTLVVRCGQRDCDARFCTRLCQSRAQSIHHAVLCPGQNPSIKPFNRFLVVQKWLSLAMVSKMLARVLLSHGTQGPDSLLPAKAARNEKAKATVQESLSHLDAFATVSELERRARNPGWSVEKEAFLKGMREAHTLLCQGLDPRAEHKGKFPVPANFPAHVAEQLFSWDTFLLYLGRANLNTEAQGGLMTVHSHFNHDCEPNIHITHPPSRHGVRQATKVSAVAKRAIEAGEELTITYQDPSTPLARRRMLLWREYMFGPCACKRCLRELAELDDAERAEMDKGAWMHDEKAEDEVQRRRDHAEMIERLDQERKAKLASEGKPVEELADLRGVEEELRTHLGF